MRWLWKPAGGLAANDQGASAATGESRRGNILRAQIGGAGVLAPKPSRIAGQTQARSLRQCRAVATRFSRKTGKIASRDVARSRINWISACQHTTIGHLAHQSFIQREQATIPDRRRTQLTSHRLNRGCTFWEVLRDGRVAINAPGGFLLARSRAQPG